MTLFSEHLQPRIGNRMKLATTRRIDHAIEGTLRVRRAKELGRASPLAGGTLTPEAQRLERAAMLTFRQNNAHWLSNLSEIEQEQLLIALAQKLRGQITTSRWRNVLASSKALAE